MTTILGEPVTVVDLVEAVRRQQTHRPAASPEHGKPPGTPIANVVAAHPGAGATSVAVALADAVGILDHKITLVDLASTPDAFAAIEREVESGDPDRRVGRRAGVTVVRSRSWAPGGRVSDGVIIVDGGQPASARVLVCRATIPSICRAECLLVPDAALAVVGVRRWPKRVLAALGPALAQATGDGRVAFFPHNRDLELGGVDAEPTPSSVLAAGARLAELLWPDLAGSPSPSRRKGLRR